MGNASSSHASPSTTEGSSRLSSYDGGGSDRSSKNGIASSSLHGNLIRTLRNRDPNKVYEVVKVLGDGSMGSVAKVKKRNSFVGGSARPDFVKEFGTSECCLPILSFCLPRHRAKSIFLSTTTIETASNHSVISATSDKQSRPLFRKTSSLLTTGSKKEVVYALKSIHLDRCMNEELQLELKNEVAILKDLDHPNIVRAIETFDYSGRLFIALELCNGGDLYTRDPYTERDACRITGCLLSAVAYLHSKGIIHRDLKYENCMFSDNSIHAEVKIIDFGLSKKFAANEHLKDTVGTVYTMAPELLSGDYNEKADVWSLGVMAFMLLSSSMPFYGRNRSQVIKKIARGRYHFSSRRWRHVSDEAIEFVRTLLQKDPSTRPSAEEALKLPWMSKDVGEEIKNAEAEMMDSIQASIQAFAKYGTLKKLGLMVVAYKSTSDEVGFLRSMFRKIDSNPDGEISREEFAQALAVYDYTTEEVDALYDAIDVDGTGSVQYIEFLAATLEALGPVDEDRLAEAFDRIDSDDSGYISIENLHDFLGDEVPVEHLEKIIDEADILKDRRISFLEFLELWEADSHEKLQAVKQEVKAHRIISREPSMVSSISSSEDLFDIDGDLPEGANHAPLTGCDFFQKQQEHSVRTAWI